MLLRWPDPIVRKGGGVHIRGLHNGLSEWRSPTVMKAGWAKLPPYSRRLPVRMAGLISAKP
jgi:hypothetical protein